LSISEKLADYEETKELLGRLKVRELRTLARQSNIALENKDWANKIVPVKNKDEIIDILVDSEFKESDLVKLLGPSRLEKEELLNYMKVKELRELAREHNVVLQKSALFGTKRAARKDDIVEILESQLSPTKIRQYSKQIALIEKEVEKEVEEEAAMKRKAERQKKTRKKIKPIGLSDIKKHDRFIKVLNTPHAMRVLLALDTLKKPCSLDEVKDQIRQAGDWLTLRQLRYATKKLQDLYVIEREYEPKGTRRVSRFQANLDGKKIVKAFKKFLRELER
jgi:hypothetical protein